MCRSKPCSIDLIPRMIARFFARTLRAMIYGAYWLAHRMRAIQSTSVAANGAVGVLGVERRSSIDFRGPALELLRHHFAGSGPHHDAVAAADRRRRRNQDDVAVAIGRLHRMAGDFERIGVLVADAPGKRSRPSLRRPESRRRRNSRRLPASAKPRSGTARAAVAAAGIRSARRRRRSACRSRPAPWRSIRSRASARGPRR